MQSMLDITLKSYQMLRIMLVLFLLGLFWMILKRGLYMPSQLC